MNSETFQYMDSMHLSLDEARAELRKRWNNAELKKAIEDELGEHFLPQFADRRRGVVFRQLYTPGNSAVLFFQEAKYIGVDPLVLEFHDDIFTHLNDEKKGLGRLRIELEDGAKAAVDIMNFQENEKRKMGECVLKTGELMIEFHHRLFEVLGYPIELFDNSRWFKQIGRAVEYYYPFLLHFVAHGVLFENVEPYYEDGSESAFILNVTYPAIRRIEQAFGLRPLIVRIYPLEQTPEEDFYWWSYPPQVNDYIVEYARKHNLKMKEWRG